MQAAPETISIEITDGVRVVSAADLRDMTTYVLLEQEDWFEPEMDFVRRFAQPGMHMIDIGANHGVYSLAFARRLAGQGHVWAFEPASGPFACLAASIEAGGLAGLITPFQAGVSEAAGEAMLNIGRSSELNSLREPGAGGQERIRLESLDGLAERTWERSPVDFVKLDAEGEELAILKGARQFLARQSPVILFEIRHGTTVNEGLAEAMLEAGFGLYRWLPGPAILAPVDLSQPLDAYQLNLFAVKPQRAAALGARSLLAADAGLGARPSVLPAWTVAFEKLPFAGAVLPQWRLVMDNARDPVARAHRRSLEAYLASTDAASAPGSKVALLVRAVEGWQQLRPDAPGVASIGMCLARALDDLGRRTEASQVLAQVLEALSTPRQEAFSLPFLPPLREFDRRAARGSGNQWLEAGLIEAMERWHAFSGYFDPETEQRISGLLNNPDLLPITRRRHALAALREDRRPDQASLAKLGMIQEGHRNAAWFARAATVTPGSA